MLYIGHFSSGIMDGSEEPWCASLTLVVEARTVAAALRAFQGLATTTARRQLPGVTEIFLDACIEIRTLPRAGIVTYLNLREGIWGGVSTTLPGMSGRGVRSYEIGPPAVDDVEQTVEPFLSLPPKPRRRGRTPDPPNRPPRPDYIRRVV
jgi:hypothetical protein